VRESRELVRARLKPAPGRRPVDEQPSLGLRSKLASGCWSSNTTSGRYAGGIAIYQACSNPRIDWLFDRLRIGRGSAALSALCVRSRILAGQTHSTEKYCCRN